MEASDQEGRDVQPHVDPGQRETAGSPAAAGREKDLAESGETSSPETETHQGGAETGRGGTGGSGEDAPPA